MFVKDYTQLFEVLATISQNLDSFMKFIFLITTLSLLFSYTIREGR